MNGGTGESSRVVAADQVRQEPSMPGFQYSLPPYPRLYFQTRLGRRKVNARMRRFQIATEEEIKGAATTDVYFIRTKEILEKEGLSDFRVTAEITTGSLPNNWPWGIFAGVEEAAHLLEGIPIHVSSL